MLGTQKAELLLKKAVVACSAVLLLNSAKRNPQCGVQ
jgi:hypothetical protein